MAADAEGIVGLYERHAQRWASDRGDKLVVEKAWLDRFVALLPPGGRVLDLGCGASEPIAGSLIRQGFPVTGIDSSATMIGLCLARHPTQEWLVHDMRSLALSRRFDGVVAWDSFFHLAFDDQRRMFPIFRDHTAPGAPLMFTSGPKHGEAIGSYRGEPLYHASLAPDEYKTLLDTNGFDVVQYVPEDPDCGGHTIWLARRKAD